MLAIHHRESDRGRMRLGRRHRDLGRQRWHLTDASSNRQDRVESGRRDGESTRCIAERQRRFVVEDPDQRLFKVHAHCRTQPLQHTRDAYSDQTTAREPRRIDNKIQGSSTRAQGTLPRSCAEPPLIRLRRAFADYHGLVPGSVQRVVRTLQLQRLVLTKGVEMTSSARQDG